MAIMAEPSGAFDISVRDAVEHLAAGLVNADLDRMIATGLAEGLGHPVLGPAFIGNLLEPMLQAVEARLEHHVRAGEMRAGETRLAAVQLAAPIIVAVLHQRPLGGAAVRPLDLDTLLVAHAEAFVRAWHACAPGAFHQRRHVVPGCRLSAAARSGTAVLPKKPISGHLFLAETGYSTGADSGQNWPWAASQILAPKRQELPLSLHIWCVGPTN